MEDGFPVLTLDECVNFPGGISLRLPGLDQFLPLSYRFFDVDLVEIRFFVVVVSFVWTMIVTP